MTEAADHQEDEKSKMDSKDRGKPLVLVNFLGILFCLARHCFD